MRVQCEISGTYLINENGYDVPGVYAECPRCGHSTEAYGEGDGSVKRCLMALREECPRAECNFYEGEL